MDDIFAYLVKQLPDFARWASLVKDKPLAWDMFGFPIFFTSVARVVKAFCDKPNIDNSEKLKDLVINTVEVKEEDMNAIIPQSGALMGDLGQLWALMEKTEQTVKSLSVAQPVVDYEDLPLNFCQPNRERSCRWLPAAPIFFHAGAESEGGCI